MRHRSFWIALLLSAVVVVTSCYAEEADPFAGWSVQKATAGPLHPDEAIKSLAIDPSRKILNNAFIAYGTTIKTSEADGEFSYCLPDGGMIPAKLPAKIEFVRNGIRYAVIVDRDENGKLCWFPHYGVDVKIDNTIISILDLDMDGKIGEEKADALCGPDSATLMKFEGSVWTETAGYSLKITGTPPLLDIHYVKLPFPRDGKDVQINRAWAAWMCLRQQGGAGHIEWSDKLAENCQLHAEYCAKNGRASHEEDKNNPHYTPGGAYAGIRSNVAWYRTDLKGFILAFYQTAYHCAHMVSPKLQHSGFGYTGRYFVVDVRSSTRGAAPKPVELVWPAHGLKDVNTSFFFAGEDPMPLPHSNNPGIRIGQVVFARVYTGGPYSLKLVDNKGVEVDGYFTSPTQSCPAREANSDLVVLAPKKNLKPATRYIATLTVGKGKSPFVYRWSFTTRK